jgi:hypothetical protein
MAPPTAIGQTPLSIAQVAKKVSPSVVVIQGKTDSEDVLGSGFIVSKDGKIVTNLQLIRDIKTASVQLPNGETFDSISVLATDERRDLAIVQVAGFNLPVLELGNSDFLNVGDPLVIVGSPRGLEGTVTAGILSSLRDSGKGFKVLQTDAAVNPGNSGGPLVNHKGQAIGVVSFKLRSAEGLNFAVPINYIRGLLNNLHDPLTLEGMRRSLVGTTSAAEKSGGASLKETLDWLKDKLPLGGTQFVVSRNGIVYSELTQVKAWDLAACTVSVGKVTVESSRELGVDTFTNRYTLPLGSLSESSVIPFPVPNNLGGGTFISGERFAYNLLLTTNSKEIVWLTVLERQRDGATDHRTSSEAKFSLMFSDQSIAKRILEAFRHAADLCRGKEPF